MEAVKKGHAPTPTYTPEFLRDMKYLEALRQLCKMAVYSKWNSEKNPSTLLEVYMFVRGKVKEMVSTGQWDTEKWTPPSKRTVDRRVNECADRKHWDGLPPLLALRGGVYIPNPALFEDEVKRTLEKLSMG